MPADLLILYQVKIQLKNERVKTLRGKVLVSYFSASGKALSLGPKVLLGGRTESRTDVRPAT